MPRRKRFSRGKKRRFRKVKRKFNAKRRFKRSRQYKSKNKLTSKSFPFRYQWPDRLKTKMRGLAPLSLTFSGSVTSVSQSFQGNKMNDIAFELSNNQPYNYDQFALNYEGYIVKGVKAVVKYQIWDTTATATALIPREMQAVLTPFHNQSGDTDLTNLHAGVQDMQTTYPARYANTKLLVVDTPNMPGGRAPRIHKQKMYMSVKKLLGMKYSPINQVVWIDIASDPDEVMDINFLVAGVRGENVSSAITVRGYMYLTYYVTWVNPRFAPASTTATTTVATGGNQTATFSD